MLPSSHLPSKSRLGYSLLAFAGTGRLKLYRPIDHEQQRHHGRLLRELETARYELKGMEQFTFFVPIREGQMEEMLRKSGEISISYGLSPAPVVA